MQLVNRSVITVRYQSDIRESLAVASSAAAMAEKRSVPTVKTREELQQILSDFLDKNKKLAVLLDYDGTLSPIVSHPDAAYTPKDTEDALKTLAQNPNIFIAAISGRGLSDIKKKIGIPNLSYAGNHGLEIENPDGTRADYQLPEDVKAEYRKLFDELDQKLARHGAWVEDKGATLTYHYRETPSEFVDELRAEAIRIIESHGYQARGAHCAVEGKPAVNWNKGEAALYILKQNFGENWRNEINVIFAGDDTTDEDAMRVLQNVGKTFRISQDPNIETYAHYRLPSTNETAALLHAIQSVYT